ncbi:MAG: hypothetical protein OIN88_05605 [Candidatus Methanoperedens sp.]|nr:hypothetical protein [Candidatus Methanoperedens sp.]HLB71992.1 hypothetical protein [Candidatus Methanoperedens sp.]
MDSEKIDIRIFKLLIFEAARNDFAALSEIAARKKLNFDTVKQHADRLEDLGILEYIGNPAPSEKRPDNYDLLASIKLKQSSETLQKITKLLSNRELSRFMKTKYHIDNHNYFRTWVLNSLNENKLIPLPDAEYLDYAIKNSPSSVRFFFMDNNIGTLKSFYERCISTKNEKVKDRINIELLKKYNVYVIWDNVIFGKIQEDLQNRTLLDPVNFFAGYLPLAKITFEKLLKMSDVEQKEV